MNDRIVYTCEIEDGLGLITYLLIAFFFSCIFFSSIGLFIYTLIIGKGY